jgi:hypothetical protein
MVNGLPGFSVQCFNKDKFIGLLQAKNVIFAKADLL